MTLKLSSEIFTFPWGNTVAWASLFLHDRGDNSPEIWQCYQYLMIGVKIVLKYGIGTTN